MKKKVFIISSIIIIVLVISALVTSYADSARVRNAVEPIHTIKIVSENGNKVTYWGLGYKIIRYPSVSPKEPYKNNRGVKYGSWFMNYELTDTELDITELKEKYPMFFNVSTDGGLTVYIWQMSKNSYSCYLANTFMEALSDNSFVYEIGASIPEMREILATYDIDKKDVTIQAITNPLSSYFYEINNEYREMVKELFWKD